jgi:serine/threonine-protein kinase
VFVPSSPPLVGRVLADKYVLVERIGEGGMGAVYRAHRLADGAVLAVKVMHPWLGEDLRRRFRREARAARAVEHPGSVRVFDAGTSADGTPYIAMELLEGRDLAQVIRQEWPLPDARLADLLAQILDVLACAHAQGIVHRDLKPENVVVTLDERGEERIKVCDFGLAKILEGGGAGPPSRWETHGGTILGTPEYMAPEQARGEPVDARTDVYALGVLSYQLLTSRLPFNADSLLTLALLHVIHEPTPPREIVPHVHAGLEAICMRALAKRMEDRFQSAGAMRDALAAVRPQLGSRAPRPGQKEPPSDVRVERSGISHRPTRAERPAPRRASASPR